MNSNRGNMGVFAILLLLVLILLGLRARTYLQIESIHMRQRDMEYSKVLPPLVETFGKSSKKNLSCHSIKTPVRVYVLCDGREE